jgi:alpha-galactosidase
MSVPNGPLYRLCLEGLNSNANYRIDNSELVIGGDQLMNYGINQPKELTRGDFSGKLIYLKAE